MSEKILKAQVAEGYRLDYNKIKKFEVLGYLGKEDLDNGKQFSITEYGLSFEYEGKSYQMEAKTEDARKLCVIARAADKNELVMDLSDTDFDYFYLPTAYDLLCSAISESFEYENNKHQNVYNANEITENRGYEYDGYFGLKQDAKKVKVIKRELEKNNK